MKKTARVVRAAAGISILILAGLLFPSIIISQAAEPQDDPALQAEQPAALSPSGPLVSIDFNNVDIGVFVKFMSDLTKKNFVIDDKVRGKVTIISPGKITVAEAYKVFESVLEVYGFAAVPSGEITKIIPSPDARTKSIKTRLEEESDAPDDTVVTQIIPLRYADPEEVKRLFTPLVSKNSVILSYQATNTLIITDVYSNIRRLLDILKSIDITGVGQQIAIIPVEYADATKLVTVLTSVFQTPQKAKPGGQKDITFVADERTNVIVVLGSEGDVDNIRQLVKTLDKETPKGQSKIHVYYLEHAPAEDLAKVLMDIPEKGATATGSAKEGKPTAPVVSDKVRITADKATNSLIIMADLEEYLTLETIIRKVDIPRAMVYIEALIMEVNVSKDFNLGTEWIIGDTMYFGHNQAAYGGGFKTDNSILSYSANTTTGTISPTLPSGMALGIFGEALSINGLTFPSIGAVIQAYKKDTDVRILSTPQILTTDNQEAKIYVGKNIPFQTTATASTTGTEIYNSYEYKDVGKTLKITPQISKDRLVRLELSLEVTALESSADNRPTTLKRTVETTAIVQDGRTVVLGGLIDDSQGLSEYRVPCLGDIPGLGMLFKSKATAFEQSNLYVFLTPRVLKSPEEAKQVYSKKRNEIENLGEEKIKLYKHQGIDRDPPPPIIQPGSQNSLPESERPESLDLSDIEPVDAPEASPQAQQSQQHLTEPITEQGRLASEPATPAPTPDAVEVGVTPTPPRAVQSGVAAVTPPQGAGPSTTEPVREEPGAHGFTVQVASVQTPQAADAIVQELIDKGYAAYAVRSQMDGQTWYRLRIGYYGNQAAAEQIMKQLRGHQYTPILIRL